MKHVVEKPLDKKARLKLQRRVKRPVFILVAFLSFSAWTIQLDEEASGLQINISLVAFVVLALLYHRILTDAIDWTHRQLREEEENRGKPTRLSGFIAYTVATLLSTVAFVGLYLLVFNVFF